MKMVYEDIHVITSCYILTEMLFILALHLNINTPSLQTSNTVANQFYLANGFVATEIIKDYYKRIEPPDCFLLRKAMKEGYEIKTAPTASKDASTDVEH